MLLSSLLDEVFEYLYKVVVSTDDKTYSSFYVEWQQIFIYLVLQASVGLSNCLSDSITVEVSGCYDMVSTTYE